MLLSAVHSSNLNLALPRQLTIEKKVCIRLVLRHITSGKHLNQLLTINKEVQAFILTDRDSVTNLFLHYAQISSKKVRQKIKDCEAKGVELPFQKDELDEMHWVQSSLECKSKKYIQARESVSYIYEEKLAILMDIYTATKSPADLEALRQYAIQSLDFSDEFDCHLAIFLETGDVNDLALARRAASQTSYEDNGCSNPWLSLYQVTRNPQDLEKAIKLVDDVTILRTRAGMCLTIYKETKDSTDFKRALEAIYQISKPRDRSQFCFALFKLALPIQRFDLARQCLGQMLPEDLSIAHLALFHKSKCGDDLQEASRALQRIELIDSFYIGKFIMSHFPAPDLSEYAQNVEDFDKIFDLLDSGAALAASSYLLLFLVKHIAKTNLSSADQLAASIKIIEDQVIAFVDIFLVSRAPLYLQKALDACAHIKNAEQQMKAKIKIVEKLIASDKSGAKLLESAATSIAEQIQSYEAAFLYLKLYKCYKKPSYLDFAIEKATSIPVGGFTSNTYPLVAVFWLKVFKIAPDLTHLLMFKKQVGRLTEAKDRFFAYSAMSEYLLELPFTELASLGK